MKELSASQFEQQVEKLEVKIHKICLSFCKGLARRGVTKRECGSIVVSALDQVINRIL